MSKVINNLTPETQYYFKVLGSNAAGNSPYSEVVGYRTKKADEVPGKLLGNWELCGACCSSWGNRGVSDTDRPAGLFVQT